MNRVYISIDIIGDLGIFRKSDGNAIMFTSYNLIPRTVVLGIFGAIIGLEGYKEKGKFPEFYNIFKEIKIGIKPLIENGIFQKGKVVYTNTSGLANSKNKHGTVLIVREQFLLNPAYRIYAELDMENLYHKRLYTAIKKGETEFNLYFGKNEFFATYVNFREYEALPFQKYNAIELSTIFSVERIKPTFEEDKNISLLIDSTKKFILFERIPIKLDEDTGNYVLEKFCYTNMKFVPGDLRDLFIFKENSYSEGVYLF